MYGTSKFHRHSAALSKDHTELRDPHSSGTHQASSADSHNFSFAVRSQVLRKPKLWGHKSLLTAISRCSEVCLDLFAQAAPKDSSWSSFGFLPVLKAEIIRLSTNTLQNGFDRTVALQFPLLCKYFRKMCKASGFHLKWTAYSKEPLEWNGWKHITDLICFSSQLNVSCLWFSNTNNSIFIHSRGLEYN